VARTGWTILGTPALSWLPPSPDLIGTTPVLASTPAEAQPGLSLPFPILSGSIPVETPPFPVRPHSIAVQTVAAPIERLVLALVPGAPSRPARSPISPGPSTPNPAIGPASVHALSPLPIHGIAGTIVEWRVRAAASGLTRAPQLVTHAMRSLHRPLPPAL
jgi:hypothetical protein